MENEIMNYEDDVLDTEIVEDEGSSGIGTGVAIAIGAGLAFAATAVVKLVKKGIAKHKAKKELHKPDEDEVVEVSEEDLVDVSAK